VLPDTNDSENEIISASHGLTAFDSQQRNWTFYFDRLPCGHKRFAGTYRRHVCTKWHYSHQISWKSVSWMNARAWSQLHEPQENKKG
jgi:hypothetical protein